MYERSLAEGGIVIDRCVPQRRPLPPAPSGEYIAYTLKPRYHHARLSNLLRSHLRQPGLRRFITSPVSPLLNRCLRHNVSVFLPATHPFPDHHNNASPRTWTTASAWRNAHSLGSEDPLCFTVGPCCRYPVRVLADCRRNTKMFSSGRTICFASAPDPRLLSVLQQFRKPFSFEAAKKSISGRAGLMRLVAENQIPKLSKSNLAYDWREGKQRLSNAILINFPNWQQVLDNFIVDFPESLFLRPF